MIQEEKMQPTICLSGGGIMGIFRKGEIPDVARRMHGGEDMEVLSHTGSKAAPA